MTVSAWLTFLIRPLSAHARMTARGDPTQLCLLLRQASVDQQDETIVERVVIVWKERDVVGIAEHAVVERRENLDSGNDGSSSGSLNLFLSF